MTRGRFEKIIHIARPRMGSTRDVRQDVAFHLLCEFTVALLFAEQTGTSQQPGAQASHSSPRRRTSMSPIG
jgi:hypothetical protein